MQIFETLDQVLDFFETSGLVTRRAIEIRSPHWGSIMVHHYMRFNYQRFSWQIILSIIDHRLDSVCIFSC
jgi:hypothetical protein